MLARVREAGESEAAEGVETQSFADPVLFSPVTSSRVETTPAQPWITRDPARLVSRPATTRCAFLCFLSICSRLELFR